MKLLFRMPTDKYIRTCMIYKQTQTTQINENRLVQINLLAVILWLVVEGAGENLPVQEVERIASHDLFLVT